MDPPPNGYRKSGTIEGAFWSWLSTVVNLLALLVVGKLIAIYLPKEEVAIFSLLLVWSDGLTLLFGYGLQVSIPKIIGATPDPQKSTVSHSLLTFILINSIFISISLFFTWLASKHIDLSIFNSLKSSLIYPHFWLVPILFTASLLRDTLLANLSGFQVFAKRAIGVALASTLQILMSIAVLIFLKGSVITLTVAYATSYFLTVIFLFSALPKSKNATLRLSHISSAIKFSWILWLNSILNYLVQRFDTILFLYLTANPAQVATYEMAKRICQLASRMLNSLLLPYLPKISELISQAKQKESSDFFIQTQLTIAIISLIGLFTLPIIQKHLILLLFSPEYLEITSVLAPLMAGIVVAVLTGISGQTLIASNRPYLVTLTNIGTAIISLALNLILIPKFGLPGAGWSALISFSFSYIAQTLWVRKTSLNFNYKKILIVHSFLLSFLILSLLKQTTLTLSLNVILIPILLIISLKFKLFPYQLIINRMWKITDKQNQRRS